MSRGFLFRSRRSQSRRVKWTGHCNAKHASPARRLIFEALEHRRVLAAPVVIAGPDTTLPEGSAFARTGSFSDVGSQAWTAHVDYGDGAGPQTLSLNSDKTFQLNHVYADNGNFTATVTVTDGELEVGSDSVLVSVQNVVPNLFVRGRQTVNEGVPLTVVDIGMFTDPGFDNSAGSTVERFTYSINWGDDSSLATGSTTIDVAGSAGKVTRGTFDGTHTYTRVGKFNAALTVKDDDNGASVTRFMTVVVNNAAPVVNAGADVATSEGQAVVFAGSYTDSGTLAEHTIQWDFGDGTNVDGTLTPTHVYADNGTYSVKLTVTDGGGLSHTDTLTATIANVVPTLTVSGSQVIDEGATLTLAPVGQFTDPGFSSATAATSETFTYSINWGDGTALSTGAATITQPGSAGTPTAGSFGGSHVYADNGTYTAVVTVTDDDGGAASKNFQVTVRNVAPTLVLSGNQQATVGVLLDVANLGVLTDPGFANPLNTGGEVAETFTYSINWGDGTALSTGAATIDQAGSAGVPTGGYLGGSHTYQLAGSYLVTVRVFDDDDGLDEAKFDVDVVAPAASAVAEGIARVQGAEAGLSQRAALPLASEPDVRALDAVEAVLPLNEPPTLFGPGNLTMDEGSFTMTDLGIFFDTDSMGPFEYHIDWGDESAATTGTATIDLPGLPTVGSFDGSHVYGDDGLFTMSLSVTDEQGGASTEVFDVTVNNVVATLANVTNNSPLKEGGTVTLTGDIVDLGAGDAHVLVVQWGDGNTDTFEYAAGLTSFEETHLYENNLPLDAPYTVHLEVTDVGQAGGSTTAEVSVVVQNVAPTAVDDIYVHVDGGVLTIDAAHGVLVNDTDPGHDALTAIEYSTPSTGTLVGNPDGSFAYTPPQADFSGIVHFTYKAQDSDGAISVSAATVTVDSTLRGSISGYVRAKSSNGAAAVAIPGVTITLTETTSQDVLRVTTLTGDDGSYRFGGLRAGSYTVTETQPTVLRLGGAESVAVVLAGDDAQNDVNFDEGWVKPEFVSVRNFLASGSLFNASLPPASIRLLVARGEEGAGHAAQAAAIRAGGSQTTAWITASAGADQILFTAGPTHHKISLNDRLPLVFDASEVEAFKIDGAGGNDTARLVGSASADIFRLRPASEASTLQLPGYSLQSSAYVVAVENVEQVTAEGGGGYDRAYLYDSPGNDLLTSGGNSARLTFAGTDPLWVETVDCDWVRASGNAGGQNSKQSTAAIDFVLETEGPWTNLL
ncbi:MAG: PKD domain-containing protein [Pirellulaceae bacterium]